MKALTNILTRLLMLLLLMLVACTEDTAEVDDLVRGEEYVTVRMQVSGMKAAATRADDGVIESITALVYRGGVLKKIETATELTTTNFKMPKPLKDDVIHFLGNVPSDVTSKLPVVGTEESELCGLTTRDYANLSYWGKTNYTGGDVIDNVTLYRNMAKIEIAPDPNECTFPEDQLFIVGLFNANQSGALVPYNGSFNFDLTTNDYFTLPADVEKETDAEERPLVTSLYVFEHDNPDAYTEANKDNFFCVICKIGKYYYKVALTSDGETPYDIIRNHRYVIYVKDLDEGAADYPTALTADPINLEIKVEKEVALSIAEQDISLSYSTKAREEVTLTVTVPAGVQTLTVGADAFTVTTGDGKVTHDNGTTYRVNDTTAEQTVLFKLRLNNDATNNHTITISGTGADQYTTVAEATTTINSTLYNSNVTNEETLWLGAVKLDNNNYQTQIPVLYNLFYDGETALMAEGSKFFFEYEGSDGWIQAATPNADAWQTLPGFNGESGSPIVVTITNEVLAQIKANHHDVYGEDAAFFVQGNGGKTLKKIYLVRANGAITAAKANDNPLYHNADNQSITVTATVPAGVSTLYITAPDFNFNGDTDGDYTYALNGQTTVQLEFSLKQDVNEVKTSTIKFSGDYVSSTTIDVEIAELDIPDVTITSTSNTTLYWNDGNPTSFDVTVSVPTLDGCSLNQLNITADGFTIKQDGNTLGTNSYTDNNSRAAGTTVTYTFTPTGTGNGKTIKFTGSGTMVDVHETSFTIDVPTITASADKTELYYNVADQTVTVTATIPTGVSAISIEATDFSVAPQNGVTFDDDTNTFTCNGATTAVFVFTLNSGIESDKKSTITFNDATEGNKVGSAPVNIDLIEQTETPTGLTITLISSTTTIDLAEGGNKTVQLRITQPDGFKISQIQTNYAFDIVGINGTASPSENGSTHYYYNPVTSNSIDLEFTVNDGIWGIAGEFTINFISNSQTISTTISVVNTALTGNIIWQGNVTVGSANATPILSGSLINYVNKTLRVLVQIPDNTDWKQLVVSAKKGYSQSDYIKFTDQEVLKPGTEVSLDISLPTSINDFPEQFIFGGTSNITIKQLMIVD
ncbi:MAG: hypothetical protein E7098_05595 [Mediterranea massiliensis]|nr:hypothetical protein [Mediterranea massiliensis]